MKEYFGKTATYFKQTGGKSFLLNTAVDRNIPKAKSKTSKLLDLGCGNGYFYKMATKKKYQYFGLDISEEMLRQAKDGFPKGKYILGSATDFKEQITERFDVIIAIMIYPAFKKVGDIQKSMSECKGVLKKGGTFIIGIAHPSFDQYMQFGILGKNDVKTDFHGYFKSGQKMLITHDFEEGKMTFEDYHWQVEDYVDCIRSAGMSVIKVDECKPPGSLKKSDPDFYFKRSRFPTYMVLVCS